MLLQPPSPFLTGQLFTYGPNRVAFESLLASSSIIVSSCGSTTGTNHNNTTTSPEPSAPMLFESHQALLPPNKCILLGGLSDGLIPVPYTHALSEMVCHFPYHPTISSSSQQQPLPHQQQQSWSLLQPILSSSYTGFGHGTLDRDVMEIHEFIQYIIQYRNATQNIILIGHSTGCQQIVHYLKTYYGSTVDTNRTNDDDTNNDTDNDRPPLQRPIITFGAVLQAPVSDREAATIWNPNESSLYRTESEHLEQLQQHITFATTMIQEQQHRATEMMPRTAFWAPITVQRYYDLMVRKSGLDDYFSSDYTDGELRARLSHISSSSSSSSTSSFGGRLRRVIVACSGQDEYVPKHVDTEALLQRFCDAMNYRSSTTTTPTLKKENDDDDDDFKANKDPSPDIAIPLYLPHGNHNLSSNHGTDAQVLIQHIYNLMMEFTQHVVDDNNDGVNIRTDT
jgi:hypothetical protein